MVNQSEPGANVDFVLWRREVPYGSNDVVGWSIPIHGYLKSGELDALTGELKFFRVKYDSIISTEFDMMEGVPERAFDVIVVQQSVVDTTDIADFVTSNVVETSGVRIACSMEPLRTSAVTVHAPFGDEIGEFL